MDNSPYHFIYFDFGCEYQFLYFKLLYIEDDYTRCRLKDFCVKLYDNEHRKVNEFIFTPEKEEESVILYLKETARYMDLIMKENFCGDYFVIKNIEFCVVDDVNYYYILKSN